MPRRTSTAKTTTDDSADAESNPFLRYPGSVLVVTLLADKWTIPVIHALSRGTRRTGELKAELGGVSQKMLTQTLRALESHGLLERKVYPVVPPRVEYSLTPMGESINEPLAGICEWVAQHGAAFSKSVDRLQKARDRRGAR